MHNANPSEGPSPGAVVSPEEVKRWRAAASDARRRCANLGLAQEFEAEFTLQKRKHNPAEAARLALEAVALPKLLKEEIAR